MASGFIKAKPVQLFPEVDRRSFATNIQEARNRVPRNLFGAPKKGEIRELCRQNQSKRLEEFQNRYVLENNYSPIISKSALPLGESLIEKEDREYQIKLKQRNKIGNQIPLPDYDGSRILKPIEEITTRKFVDTTSAKCSSGGERPKPYDRQASIPDFFNHRKVVACNNSRTSDVHSLETANELLPHPIVENDVAIESTPPTNTSASSVTTNESSSTSSSTHQCVREQSQEQISLHTKTTDHSTELV